MSNNQQILQRDFDIFREMVHSLPDYLDSHATHWTLPEPNMPKLTIGGCLMRLHRLQQLSPNLPLDLKQKIRRETANFEDALQGRIVRFETRAHQELHDRLGEWCGYLKYPKSLATNPDYYVRVVDTRVVIFAMIDRLSQKPYKLEKAAVDELGQFDRHLRLIWQPGEFVWDRIWQPAYPPEPFWFLYGGIKVSE